ncbi:phosphotransferase [Mariniflexile sp. AS56]|nr:phosphotransferase [Mariniflexile sp. AS56]MDO7171769.1 phosphotransferase [Mariniflexile sp. AS56]
MSVFPVTASTISAKDLGEFIKERYNLDKNFNCELFRTGINHTYFISDTKTKYVLRVYSYNWRAKSEITEEIKLLNFLKENNLSVSFPIPDTNGTFIHDINAPEGQRYAVLFSFAEGGKVRFMDDETCFTIGSLMAQFHNLTNNKSMDREVYDTKSMLELPFQHLKQYFSETLPEMVYLKEVNDTLKLADFESTQKGLVHLDIWYDNMAVLNEKEITFFDFDFCGNGSQVLDVGYFCKQLFYIETDKEIYERKKLHFIKGYSSVRTIPNHELKLIPEAGLAVFIYYLGIQAKRFDWSNIFLSENYLKMFTGRLKSWIEYNNEHAH